MIFFLLPTLNEEASLAKTLEGIDYCMKKVQKKYQIIVCDNGSTDNTPQIAKEYNAITTHEPRKGYGYTLIKGIEYIQQNCIDIPEREKILIFMDADGQDNPKNILTHLKNIETVDFSIGSRVRDGKINIQKQYTNPNAVSRLHTLVNQFFGILLWIRTGKKFTDLGPFRAIRMDTFLSLDMKEYTYGWTAEMQKKVVQKGISFREFYSSPYARKAGKSKVSGAVFWKQLWIGIYIVWVIIK